MGHDGAILALKVVAKTVEIVGFRAGAGHGVHHVVHDGVGIDAIFLLGLLLLAVGHHGRHQCGHIHCLSLELDGVGGKGVFLYLVDVGLNAGGEGENEGNADDADGAGQSGENGSALFGEQVVEGEPQSSEKRHGWKPSLVTGMLCGMLRLRHVGIGIRDDFAVQKLDGAGGVTLGKLGIVGNHDDQPIPSDFLQKIHDLHAGFRIQRAGGFVCQEDFRVVDQGTGDGHPLHLAAGHLIGLFVHLIGQPHLFKGGNGSAAPLASGDAGKGQRQLHVGKDALVGD